MLHNIRTLTSAPFRPHIGTEVALETADAQVVRARLVKVEDLPRSTPPDAARLSFHLILEAPEPCPLGRGDFTLVHPGWGRLGPLYVERIFPGSLTCDRAVFEVTFG
jgi:hypothetical protein